MRSDEEGSEIVGGWGECRRGNSKQGRVNKINCISSYVASINRVCITTEKDKDKFNCN